MKTATRYADLRRIQLLRCENKVSTPRGETADLLTLTHPRTGSDGLRRAVRTGRKRLTRRGETRLLNFARHASRVTSLSCSLPQPASLPHRLSQHITTPPFTRSRRTRRSAVSPTHLPSCAAPSEETHLGLEARAALGRRTRPRIAHTLTKHGDPVRILFSLASPRRLTSSQLY